MTKEYYLPIKERNQDMRRVRISYRENEIFIRGDDGTELVKPIIDEINILINNYLKKIIEE